MLPDRQTLRIHRINIFMWVSNNKNVVHGLFSWSIGIQSVASTILSILSVTANAKLGICCTQSCDVNSICCTKSCNAKKYVTLNLVAQIVLHSVLWRNDIGCTQSYDANCICSTQSCEANCICCTESCDAHGICSTRSCEAKWYL